jgi:hypothetical protein
MKGWQIIERDLKKQSQFKLVLSSVEWSQYAGGQIAAMQAITMVYGDLDG